MKIVNVTICSDPDTLGPGHDLADVVGYGAILCATIEKEFGCKTLLHFGSEERTLCDDPLVRQRIRAIESTDEWKKLLP